MKNSESATGSDLQVLAMLVARMLREEHLEVPAPGVDDYSIVGDAGYSGSGKKVEVQVSIGRGTSARIEAVWHGEGDHRLEDLTDLARDFAEGISRLRRQATDIRSTLSEVRTAARQEIAKANRRGLPYQFTSVDLAPVRVDSHELPDVRVEHLALGRSLRLEAYSFLACCREEVVNAFAGLREEQERRALHREQLDRAGATGLIDAVVVAALEASGAPLQQVLTKLLETDDWAVDYESPDQQRFRLYWKDGVVSASVKIAEGVTWHEGTLTFDKSPGAVSRLRPETPLPAFYEHPFIDPECVIYSASGKKGDRATVWCSQPLLHFDAKAGRIWPF